MPPALRALRNDHVGPGPRGSHGLGDAARHERDLAAGGVGALHIRLDVLLRPRPGKGDHGGPQRDRRCEGIVLDIEQQEVQGKRPICEFANRGRPGMNLLGRQIMAAHGAQTARAGHGGHELRRVHRTHAAKRDGVLYLQEVTYRRSDHNFTLRL